VTINVKEENFQMVGLTIKVIGVVAKSHVTRGAGEYFNHVRQGLLALVEVTERIVSRWNCNDQLT
jgi:hypothetical protein